MYYNIFLAFEESKNESRTRFRRNGKIDIKTERGLKIFLEVNIIYLIHMVSTKIQCKSFFFHLALKSNDIFIFGTVRSKI